MGHGRGDFVDIHGPDGAVRAGLQRQLLRGGGGCSSHALLALVRRHLLLDRHPPHLRHVDPGPPGGQPDAGAAAHGPAGRGVALLQDVVYLRHGWQHPRARDRAVDEQWGALSAYDAQGAAAESADPHDEAREAPAAVQAGQAQPRHRAAARPPLHQPGPHPLYSVHRLRLLPCAHHGLPPLRHHRLGRRVLHPLAHVPRGCHERHGPRGRALPTHAVR
mmetsp:Transcript_61576/g.151565  ORF Transcript_61576/g.151565 Transcript_61576/m.151565 type:complete len:219 (+) Transcript_61576:154-810(+)